jgi:hypothetical protein
MTPISYISFGFILKTIGLSLESTRYLIYRTSGDVRRKIPFEVLLLEHITNHQADFQLILSFCVLKLFG